MSEKIKQYLKDNNFHDRLINHAELSKDIQEKLLNMYKIISDKRVVVLSGTESPVKECFVMSMIRLFIQDDKNMVSDITASQILRRLGSTTNPIPSQVAYFLLNTDMGIAGQGINILKEFVINQIQKNKILVIGCSSLENLEKVYGTDFIDYISHVSVEIDLSMSRADIPII